DRSGEKAHHSMRKNAWDDLKKKLGEKVLEQYKISMAGSFSSEEADEQNDLKLLADLIRKKRVMLFIGAGISKSLCMPLWNELLKSLMRDEYDGELFETYGDNLMLAEYIKQKYTDKDVYQKMRECFSVGKVLDKLENSAIYRAILELDCPVIYTTNYDHLIEEYYKMKRGGNSFDRVISIEDMRHLKQNATRIMKFHGDISKRNSIVMTESEYFGRMRFDDFMDVQLQADMLQYHVLFLGYSLSDINVKMLLYMARKRQENDLKYRRKSEAADMKNFIFTVTPNQIQKAVFQKNRIITLSGEDADKERGTRMFLERLSELVKDTKAC
ncbi:MAG: SIR2 family protein, partial [Ruminococcus flavefaciens]|nr:SIR2 family protein [Ruminococcus flavefaciens]